MDKRPEGEEPMSSLRIEDLPTEITLEQAVQEAYAEDLDWIEERLRNRISVLVECDKALTMYLYMALRDRLKEPARGRTFQCRLIDGRAPSPRGGPSSAPRRPPAPPRAPRERDTLQEEESATSFPQGSERSAGYLGNLLRNLQQAIVEVMGRDDVILVVPHLDLLTTTTKSGLSLEARECIAWVYENPEVTLLGFRDPSFEMPKPLEDVFTVKYSILGIRREKLPKILLRREARKFADAELNPYQFYKYVSGLNVVKFRRLMAQFDSAPDYDPAHPETAERLYRQLREMTVISNFELPRVDLYRDIGGYEEVKRLIEEDILSLLRAKDRLTDEREVRQIEEIVPKGIIFYGPPGTGKTFFAKAIATALDATIIIVSGPELKERWVGASEENIRRVFTQARKSAPSLIVFDELDSIAPRRGMYYGSGVEHSMVNQLLTEMDGFRKEELVIVIGTTNFVESLDPALLRPGRFEMQIEIPYPDEDDRREIIKIYRDKFNLDMPDEMVEYLVERTSGFASWEEQLRFTGDHLYAICRALKRMELREGKFTVTKQHIDQVLRRRVKAKISVTSEEERVIAYHESGHALCAELLPKAEPVRKISIVAGESDIPMALGYVEQELRERKYIVTKAELEDMICVALGGRIAEELIFGDISAGAQNDLQQVTFIARAMVEELGMGHRTRNQAFRRGTERLDISGHVAAMIDDDVRDIIDSQYTRARALIQENLPLLRRLAETLLDRKVLEGDEVREILRSARLALPKEDAA